MTEQIKTHNFGMGWGKILMSLFASCLCGGVLADTWSASPSSAWDTSDPSKVVFDSAGAGTLDSTTSTQSTSASVGLSGAVSLEKSGTGTLTVNGVHGFSGDIAVKEGTLEVGNGTHDVANARNSAFGDPRSIRKITVWTNGTLSVTKAGLFGNGKTSTTDVLADLEIRGGTLSVADGIGEEFGNVLLFDATVNIGNGTGSGKWPGFMLSGDWLEFGSSTATPFTLSTSGGVRFGKREPVDIRVPDITGDGDSDVVFSAALTDSDGTNWDSPTNFVKTGSGTLEFAHSSSTFCRDAVISNGTLKLSIGSARIGNAASALGSTVVPHTIYVENDATLQFTKSDLLGQIYNNPTGVCIHVRRGTLVQREGCSNPLGPLVLEDATLSYGYGGWYQSGAPRWPTFAFSDVTFKGTTAYDVTEVSSGYFVIGMNGMGNVRVEDIVSGGVYSAAPDVTFSAPIHDCLAVWGGNGPRASTFRKTGTGVMKLANLNSSFTGDMEIAEGVVTLSKKGTNSGYGPTSGPLGNLMVERTIMVCGTGEIYYSDSDQLGQACADYAASFVVSNGTVRFKSGTVNAWPTVKFYDANLIYENGVGSSGNGDSAYWGLWAFRYPVTFDGTKTFSLPSKGARCIMSLGYSSDSSEVIDGDLTYCHGRTEFRVEDMTSNGCIDVDIGMDIQSLPYWNSGNNKAKTNHRYRCGLLKTGPGTLRIGGKFTCPEDTRINEGSLVFDGTLAEQQSGWGKSAMQVQDGAYLGGTGTVQSVTIDEGGGFTSAIGQTGALEINGTVTLPASGNVPLNIVCTNDLETLVSYRTPIVKSSKLGGARFVPVFNGGAALPPNLGLTVSEQNGVIYGIISRKGMTIIFK